MSGCHKPHCLGECCGEIRERITKLESDRLGQGLDPQVWKYVSERLDKLESKTMFMIDIEENLKQWKWMHDQISRLDMLLSKDKKPYECPMCEGKRLDLREPIPGTGGLKFDICLVCKGTGLVWE